MPISANTLFHFTRFQYLKSILSSKAFYPRLSFEVFINQDDFIVAYPMVCFCDLPLSNISYHAEKYHRNGIGLKKEWGYTKGINPVFYIQKESLPNKMILESIKEVISQRAIDKSGNIGIVTKNVHLVKTFFDLTAYYKPREGKEWDRMKNDFSVYSGRNRIPKTINFYDEREWRYVPPNHRNIKNGIPINFRLASEFYDDGVFLDASFIDENNKLEEYKLEFSVNDIKYLIVSRTTDQPHLAKHIKKLDNYTLSERDMLISKIMPLKQIKEDF